MNVVNIGAFLPIFACIFYFGQFFKRKTNNKLIILDHFTNPTIIYSMCVKHKTLNITIETWVIILVWALQEQSKKVPKISCYMGFYGTISIFTTFMKL